MFGGIDTTEGMILNAIHHLLVAHETPATVCGDADQLANAIEESIRLEPAAALVDRYTTGDVVLDGVQLRRGDRVSVSIAGANRDPAVFAGPDRFHIDRENAHLSLAFAQGPHFCPGAHLARTETRIAVQRLFERLPGLRLDQRRPATPRGVVFRKPAALHVRWDAAVSPRDSQCSQRPRWPR